MGKTAIRAIVALCVGGLVATAGVPALGSTARAPAETELDVLFARMEALANRQLEELGIPEDFFPFLRDDAKVRTGRDLFGEPSPDLNRDGVSEVIETDLRYSYEVGGNQSALPAVESEVDTRIVVRKGTNGKKLWAKRYDRDAYPFAMRLGSKGRFGVMVMSGLWNYFGTTGESTIIFDAFDGRGRHLWSREYRSISYYEMFTQVSRDVPIMISTFNGVKGRAEDLLIGLATIVDAYPAQTMTVRTLAIDGTDGAEQLHPVVDIGIDWWPIPLPTGDLNGDRLDDFATTNDLGVDPGGDSQQPPSVGGTVYTRSGNMGVPIWTTSGLDMDVFALVFGLPDVVVDRTPEVGLVTYVSTEEALPVPLPIDLPLGLFFRTTPRVYLLEGAFGAELWHKAYEGIQSPGDIDRNGRADLLLDKFGASFRRSRTRFDQLAVTGSARKLWKKRLVWKFETAPCPRDLCFGGWGYWRDGSPDYQPDGVRDLFISQSVEQNAAFRDTITHGLDGRTGRVRFKDDTDRLLQPAGVAIDGRGDDLMGFEYGSGRVGVTARNGMNRTLWGGAMAGPPSLVPRKSSFYAIGFKLPGDRCGDLVLDGWLDNDSYYGVFDGGNGRVLWSRWTGAPNDRPAFTDRVDRNRAC